MTNQIELSRTERDVLLLSSGELPAWRRVTLGRRLARDPAAMRLAETLALTEACLAPRRSPARLPRTPVLFAAGVAAAALAMIQVFGPREGAEITAIKIANVTLPDTPTSLRALRRNLQEGPPMRATFQAPQPGQTARPSSLLRSRTSYLDVRAPRFSAAQTNPVNEDR